MRTVYLGTSDFAADVLRTLAASAHRPALVVTRPDRPRGRGRRIAAPPVAATARELGLDVAQPEDVNGAEARERIAVAQPAAVCVCAFGALIREPLLSAHELLNVHPSLLPRWRGAAPIERAIMAGDRETGVSIMRLTEGLDAGPVGLRATEAVAPGDTFGSLSARLAQIGGKLLVAALDHPPAYAAQTEEGVTYAEKIEPADRLLLPARPAAELERIVRALQPHVGARVALPGGEMLGVREAVVAGSAPSGAVPGQFAADGGHLLLMCARGALDLLEVQPPGGRPMDAADYLRGHGLPPV